MKSFVCALLCLFVALVPVGAERQNLQITVNSTTPTRISNYSLKMDRFIIQSRHGNSGVVYILLGVPKTKACDVTDATQLTAELGPGDSLHPGASLSDPQGANGNPPAEYEDLGLACIGGTQTGDVVIVSGWRRN